MVMQPQPVQHYYSTSFSEVTVLTP